MSSHEVNTAKVNEFISTWYKTNKGDNNDVISQLQAACNELSCIGINLLEQTNLVTVKEHNQIANLEVGLALPYHIGFNKQYTGQPLIKAILEDRFLAKNHTFQTNEYYLKIVELVSN